MKKKKKVTQTLNYQAVLESSNCRRIQPHIYSPNLEGTEVLFKEKISFLRFRKYLITYFSISLPLTLLSEVISENICVLKVLSTQDLFLKKILREIITFNKHNRTSHTKIK